MLEDDFSEKSPAEAKKFIFGKVFLKKGRGAGLVNYSAGREEHAHWKWV